MFANLGKLAFGMIVVGIGVRMMLGAILEGVVRKRILKRRPDVYAHGRQATVLGILDALLALIPISGGILLVLSAIALLSR